MRTIAGRGLLLCAFALGGCYRATFISNPQVTRGVEHDQWNHFFIFGLVGEANLDVRQFCPDGRVAEVQTQETFLNGLVGLLTIGIYAPRTVYVTCAAGSRALLELDADPQGRPVAARLRREGSVDRATVTPEGAAFRVALAEDTP
jgi:hypothetical protein